ncbi:Ribose ABC transport system, high affinity permease RbsD [Photobacterium marinum]|uniref:D-ribose pyranase n=1 Tax=Photobacterium marinum TaxID=1056511 RepID=L8JHL4_9GAMM|nr:D-ribose pyranase [Photobacterium marinum]ELR66942.1 Ribose ABC transport system, high affinity permease RbsD [Photobacterium marinum]
MKKSALINSELSYVIATLGHTDEITICDAGLPIPNETQRIDLALIPGVPTFIETVKAVLGEMQIEGVIMAEEFMKVSPAHHEALIGLIREEEAQCGKSINLSYVSHEEFKIHTQNSKAVVRTGECTPYANVIFQSGVVF